MKYIGLDCHKQYDHASMIDRDAQLLSTIPGVGITLGMLISTEIDGIERFHSPSKLCSYAGLVPSTHSSGGKTYHGRITSEGNRWLKWS